MFNQKSLYCILAYSVRSGHEMTINVCGSSMNPTMHDGDVINVRYKEQYFPGDVLVFVYKGELLVHRLLKINHNRYLCKGDNSLRIEDFPYESIIGYVDKLNGKNLAPFSSDKLSLSYLVNREFRKNKYDINKTRNGSMFRFYHQVVWENVDDTLKYRLLDAECWTKAQILLKEILCENNIILENDENAMADFLTVMQEFCDINLLLDQLLKTVQPATDHAYIMLLIFLSRGVINNIISVE